MYAHVPTLTAICDPITSDQMIALFDQNETFLKQAQAHVLQVLRVQSESIHILDRDIKNLEHQLATLKQKQKKYQSILDDLPARLRYLEHKQHRFQKCYENSRIRMQQIPSIEEEFRIFLHKVLKRSGPLIASLYRAPNENEKEAIRLMIWKNGNLEKFCWQEIERCRACLAELTLEKTTLFSQMQQVVVSQSRVKKKQRDLMEEYMCTYEWKKSVQRTLYSQKTLRLEAIVQKQIAEIEWARLYQEQQQLIAQKKDFYRVLSWYK